VNDRMQFFSAEKHCNKLTVMANQCKSTVLDYASSCTVCMYSSICEVIRGHFLLFCFMNERLCIHNLFKVYLRSVLQISNFNVLWKPAENRLTCLGGTVQGSHFVMRILRLFILTLIWINGCFHSKTPLQFFYLYSNSG